MATVLDKALKRQISVNGVDFMVVLDPEGIRVTQKGRRRAEVDLRWGELVSGEAAMAVALNASLSARPAASSPKEQSRAPIEVNAAAPKKRVARPRR